MSADSDTPITFPGFMIPPLLSGLKTQTRQIILDGEESCRFGPVGRKLWVREAFRFHIALDRYTPAEVAQRADAEGYQRDWIPVEYDADRARRGRWHGFVTPPAPDLVGKLRPAVVMPRWASRISLEVTDINVGSLIRMTSADARREGCFGGHAAIERYAYCASPLEHFSNHWDHMHGRGSWRKTPKVWVVTFRRLT